MTASTRSGLANDAGTTRSPKATLVSGPASEVPRSTSVSPMRAYGNGCSSVSAERAGRGASVIVGVWIVMA